jgi:ADP-heptose:LPS heptosyltransferase
LPRLTTRIALAWAHRRARASPPPVFEPLPRDTSARILVVNTTGIGDTIFCTAPIADLRESFPGAFIAAFVDRRRVELLYGNPRLNEIIPYPGKFKKVLTTTRLLADHNFDIAIIQHANDPDVVPMVAKAGPKHLIGYESHTFSDLYAVKLPPADRAGGAHTMDARLALTRAVGASGTHWQMELFPSEHHRSLAQGALRDAGIEPGTAIALNVGGSLPSKRWPPEHWAQLAHALSERNLPIAVVGGPGDAIAGEFVRERLGSSVKAAFLLGKLPLMASAALLTLCRAHVTPDSGLMQAGLALEVPTVALFGPDDPKWTGPHPRQANAMVVAAEGVEKPPGYDRKTDKDGLLMRAISTERVIAALDKVAP